MLAVCLPVPNASVDAIALNDAPLVLPLSIVWADVNGLGVASHRSNLKDDGRINLRGNMPFFESKI
jgi:hypothetical protein